MLAKILWLIRFAGLAVLGVLALTNAPGSRAEQAVQIACFTAASLAMVAWLLVGERARYRTRGLPVILGVMAFACGLSGVTSGSGQSLVAFAVVAALAAGTECSRPAALAVTAAGIVPIEVAGLITGSTIGTLVGYPLIIVVGLLAGLQPARLPGAGPAVRRPAGAVRAPSGRAPAGRCPGRAEPHRA